MKKAILLILILLISGCKICCIGNSNNDIPCPNRDTLNFLESQGYSIGCEHGYEDACNDYMDKYNVTLDCWDNETLSCGR